MWYAISRTRKGLFGRTLVLAKGLSIAAVNAQLSDEQRKDCYYTRKDELKHAK